MAEAEKKALIDELAGKAREKEVGRDLAKGEYDALAEKSLKHLELTKRRARELEEEKKAALQALDAEKKVILAEKLTASTALGKAQAELDEAVQNLRGQGGEWPLPKVENVKREPTPKVVEKGEPKRPDEGAQKTPDEDEGGGSEEGSGGGSDEIGEPDDVQPVGGKKKGRK